MGPLTKTLFLSVLVYSVFLSGNAADSTGTSAHCGKEKVGWEENFTIKESDPKGAALPKNWEVKTKIGADATKFWVKKDEKDNFSYLHMESDNATASLTANPGKIDLKEFPILRWRWRVTVLPEGADGRIESKDDQAIGIYVGTGNLLRKKSISYRWDTETPKLSAGECAYGAGTIKIKWFSLRNKEDAVLGKWFVEERNLGEDFKNAWGFYPEDIYISISCNSQYTGTKATADLNWIKLVSAPVKTEDKKTETE